MDTEKQLNAALAAQKKHEKSLIQRANVVSVGCGYKFKDGEKTNEICIIVGLLKSSRKSVSLLLILSLLL